MPKFEVEVDDKGEVVGNLPAEIDALFKRTETTSYGTGLKKGREDALTEATKATEERLKAEREKWEKEHPQQTARLKELEEEANRLREAEITLTRRFTEQSRTREENHAKEIADRAEAITKRDRKLREMLKTAISNESRLAGARDESLPKLEILLSHAIDFDENLELYVRGEDGKPLLKQGKPVTPAEYIREYLGTNPEFRAPVGGAGGGARGGAHHQGHGSTVTETAAVERIQQGDRSAGAINALFEAARKKAS
jgi:hypothetical protein